MQLSKKGTEESGIIVTDFLNKQLVINASALPKKNGTLRSFLNRVQKRTLSIYLIVDTKKLGTLSKAVFMLVQKYQVETGNPLLLVVFDGIVVYYSKYKAKSAKRNKFIRFITSKRNAGKIQKEIREENQKEAP
jgi:hypothetical protein